MRSRTPYLTKGRLLRRAFLIAILAGIAFFVMLIAVNKVKTSIPLSTVKTKTVISMSYHTNIIKDTEENNNFRRVLFTGKNSQLVIMSIPPGGEVGKETHKYTEQTLFFLSGTGIGEIDGIQFPIVSGDVVVVIPGTEHNFRNTGAQELKIYTVYSPPNHIDGRVHRTSADADADRADDAVGEALPK